MVLLGALSGCSKPPKPVDDTPSALDRVNAQALPAPKHVVNRSFSVAQYQAFGFEVPPHILRPKVHGSFESSVKAQGSEPMSDESTAVELLLMTPEQYDNFTHRRSAASTYAVEPSFNQQVDIDLPPTQGESTKYYLVFRNSPGGATRTVHADFSVTYQ